MKVDRKISLLRQLLKEASAIDLENAEKEAQLARAQADKALAQLDVAQAKSEMSKLNAEKTAVDSAVLPVGCCESDKVNEANADEAYVRLYDFKTFKLASAKVLQEMGNFGFVVLKDKTALYGLLFKLESEAAKKVFTGHLYSYPQDGNMIRGGVTFSADEENFGIEAEKQKGKVL